MCARPNEGVFAVAIGAVGAFGVIGLDGSLLSVIFLTELLLFSDASMGGKMFRKVVLEGLSSQTCQLPCELHLVFAHLVQLLRVEIGATTLLQVADELRSTLERASVAARADQFLI